jgi:DNA-binding PadR family transcriptional regulator
LKLDDLLPLPPHMFHVLLVLRAGPLHGYAIKREVAAQSAGRIDLDPGGLYRLIARLEARGAVAEFAPRGEPTDDRKRVFYKLTRAGEQLLLAEARRLSTLVSSKEVRELLKGVSA